jgi:beta-galactosidase
VIVPSPLTSTSSSLLHVRTSFWRGAAAHAAAGRAAWLSVSGDAALPGMAELAGCHLADRVPGGRPGTLRFVRAWGPFSAGDELELAAGDGSLATRWARLALDDGEIVATDADGGPGLVAARRGPGVVVTCAAPVELLCAGQPDAHRSTDLTWGLYAGLLVEAGIREPASVDHPDVTSGSLRGSRGGLVSVTNHEGSDVRVDLRLPPGASNVRSFRPAGVIALGAGRPVDDGVVIELDLPSYGATIVGWDDRP